MLIKNGKEKEVDNTMKGELAKVLGYEKYKDIQWEVVLDWSDNQRYIVSDEHGNQAFGYPNSYNLELVAVVKKDHGSPESWRYVPGSSYDIDDRGNYRFRENHYPFLGNTTFTESDVDLAYFLIVCCPQMKDGPNSNSKSEPVFQVVNHEAAAMKKRVQKIQEAKYTTLLWESMGDDDLRAIGKVYQISNCDTMGINELRDRIDQKVRAPKKDGGGVDVFLSKTKGLTRLDDMKGFVQQCKEVKCIVFKQDVKKWFLIDEEGKDLKELATVANQEERVDVLASVLANFEDIELEVRQHYEKVRPIVD